MLAHPRLLFKAHSVDFEAGDSTRCRPNLSLDGLSFQTATERLKAFKLGSSGLSIGFL